MSEPGTDLLVAPGPGLPGGLTIPARDLPASWRKEGQFAPDQQVSVTVVPAPPPGGSPPDYLGAGKGLFASAAEIDEYLREQRDAWG